MINGIKPLPPKEDFEVAVDKLLENIHLDYVKWSNGNPIREDEISLKPGRKFIKVIRDNSVWGFIANDDGVLKGVPYKKGDVFKAAGWASPAKWQSGSIFDKGTNWFAWTGPRYL